MLRKKLKLNNETNNESPQTNDEIPNDDNITSKYFQKPFWLELYEIECNLKLKYKNITFSQPVASIYNPIEYASELHCNFLKKFLNGPKKILFIGMNPGPWGMCQTGVIKFQYKII